MAYYVVYGELNGESVILGEFKNISDAVKYRSMMKDVYSNTFIQEFWKK